MANSESLGFAGEDSKVLGGTLAGLDSDFKGMALADSRMHALVNEGYAHGLASEAYVQGRSSYRTAKSSLIGRRVNLVKPASVASSRAFSSPIAAPIPAPP